MSFKLRDIILQMSARRLSLVRMVLLALLAVGALGAGQGQAASDDQQFLQRVKADTKWLNDYGTRQIGTAAHRKLQDDLLAKLREIPNVKVWTDEFETVVPVYQETSLQFRTGATQTKHDIYPLWPDVARLNTTPAGGINGKLIYVGEASFKEIPGLALRGQIAVMEMSAYEHYRRVFDHGAAAVIFVESDKPGKPLPSLQSLYKPRYYVPAGPLADALRAGQIGRARIVCKGKWQTVTARNIYVGVNSTAGAHQNPYAVVAPYDSMSRVWGAAPGADSAVDCAIVLNLLREVAADAPRPLLFGFVDAYHINQMGIRRMAAMLSVTPEGRTRKDYDEVEQEELNDYIEAAEEIKQFATPEEGLAMLHDRNKCKLLRRLFKDAVGRTLLQLNGIQGELRLAASRTDKENSYSIRQQTLTALEEGSQWLLDHHRAELKPEQIEQIKAARAFLLNEAQAEAESEADKFGKWAAMPDAIEQAKILKTICDKPLRSRNRMLTAVFDADAQVDEDDLPVAKFVWAKTSERVLGQLAAQEARLAYFDTLDELRKQINEYFGREAEPEGEEQPAVGLVVGLDLSDCGVLVGPGQMCSYNRVSPTDQELTRALKRATKDHTIWPDTPATRRVVNISAIEGRDGGASDMGQRAMITSAVSSFLLNGITWLTDDAPRKRIDSPLDRYDMLDWDRLSPQIPPTLKFFDWLFVNEQYTPRIKPVWDNTAKWRNGMGRVVDISAGETVPRVPRRGFLVTLVGSVPDVDGIRRHQFAWTGHDGAFRIPLMCADVYRYHKAFNLQAYRINEFGALVESLTTSESQVSGRLATTFNLGTAPGEQLPRAVTFECTELNGPSFYDARFLEPLTQGKLMDAIRGGSPKQFQFSISSDGQMWGVVPHGIRWQLAVRAGASGIRMALLNSVKDGRERGMSMAEAFQHGFPLDQRLPSIPAEISARDIFALNEWRLKDFLTAGISSPKILEIREGTKQALLAAEAAIDRHDGAELKRQATRALASEIRAYRAVTETGQDIARGAIFLMLILVPFAVAMERLLFACSRIGRQISAAVAIFAVMTLLLWSFHPAFKISAQPLVIVMAFMILAMSVAVISMVLGRFRAAMREYQSSLAEGSGAQMGRGGLLGSAVFLGIANMRKRKVRTALTGATLVLVTFALLCFSSASSYVDKRDFRLDGVEAKRSAVMVRRPSFGPIKWLAADSIRNLLGDTVDAVEARSWLVPKLGDTAWRLWMLNPQSGEQVAAMGALGLPSNEDRLTAIDHVLPNWSDFAENGGCYLSKDMAEQLGVKAGDRIVVKGYDLILRGVYDPITMEDQVRLLDGQRVLPFDYARQEQDWVNRDSQDAIEQETGSAAAMLPTGNEDELFISAREIIILPTELIEQLGGDLRSVAIACDSPEQASEVAHTLAETIVYPAYYANNPGGVNVVVTTPLIAVPPRNLAVPLVIAAMIIFTTMLNSVSERKKEIYVYSSLGLAPVHIGALFVAEALTYGLMGSVFGYIAGQGTATVLTSLGLMEGITLNYSGTAVIKTMLLVQGVVVLAAIVPAIIAGRVASPSSEMDWKVPEPVDGVITSKLPFTVSPAAASGLIAFIHEYLEAHRDGVLGRFDVDNVRLLERDTDEHVAGVESRVWLAPFDMGVRQMMKLTVEKPDDGVCEIAVSITHETGTPKLWWRLNKPYFYELRRQMLGWRKVTPERMQEYANRMESMTAENGTIG